MDVTSRELVSCGRSVTGAVVAVEGDRIAAITPGDAGDGPLVAPGLIDIQLNGAWGHDFTETPEAIWEVAARLPETGVTAFLATVITSSAVNTEAALDVIAAGPPPGFRGARVLGLHFEGPFLHPQKKGAHNAVHIRPPRVEEVGRWTRENGVRLVTLAPELDGAEAVADALREQGVVVSAGHSTATAAEARAAFDSGRVSMVTHLFNAMPPLHHREPGLAGAALLDGRIAAGIIPDGIHVHADVISLAARLKGPAGMIVVTDAMAAMGMSPGEYALGDFDVIVDETSARLADGTLAGSILRPDEALRNWIDFTGWSVADGVRALTSNPADLLGEPLGRLEVGAPADLVLLDSELRVEATLVAGELVYERE